MKRYSNNVRQCLEKSRHSALCAIEIYNKPSVKFKSSGYITLMIIAWTSLFHAIFWKKKTKPYYKKENGYHYEIIDGDYKHWDLSTCIKKYFKSDTQDPVRKNLEFFIPLRNKIEHRYLPEIDSTIFGECQAMLFNFDDLIMKEFDERFALKESLSFALQLYHDDKAHIEAIKRNGNLKSVISFIDNYRTSLSKDVVDTGKYSFQAFLFQVVNNPNKDAIPVKFFKWDDLSDEDKKRLSRYSAVFIKNKTEMIPSVIHTQQIINVFLTKKQLRKEEALSYIDAACYESSKYLPLNFFITRSGIGVDEAIRKINKSKSTKKHQKKNLIELLKNADKTLIKSGNLDTGTDSANEISLLLTEIKKRQLTFDNYNNFKRIRLLQAITHLENPDDVYPDLLNILREIYRYYSDLKQTERTSLLKAIYYLDWLLYS